MTQPSKTIVVEPKAVTVNADINTPLIEKKKKEASCYDNCCSFFQAVAGCLSACHEVCDEAGRDPILSRAGIL